MRSNKQDTEKMGHPTQDTEKMGHPIQILEIEVEEVGEHSQLLEKICRAECSGVVVRRALPEELVRQAVSNLNSETLSDLWKSPNAGMVGGEIRTIGDAATPTFTAFRGPSTSQYMMSAMRHEESTQMIFGSRSPTPHLQDIFSALFDGKPAAPPSFDKELSWAPFNYRALDPGEQIYSHHDQHYPLEIYKNLDQRFDRSTLLSWFVTLQSAEESGELIIYGLWSSDPDHPMLPTRFLDTSVLDRDFKRQLINLKAGDLVLFDSGRHVHRVSVVEGTQPRLTLGGFLTIDEDRTQVAFWS